MDLRSIGRIAARQHGLVTFAQAAQIGVRRGAWYRALERGDLAPVHRHVARLAGHAATREQRILAAVLALRQGEAPARRVLASHRSAAHLLGLERPADDPVDVIVVGPGHARRAGRCGRPPTTRAR